MTEKTKPVRYHDYYASDGRERKRVEISEQPAPPEPPGDVARLSLTALVKQLKQCGLTADQILDSLTGAEPVTKKGRVRKRVWELLKEDLAELDR